ncbi:hypothetical protein M0802_010904 [Mischocyttarus mexicanus]|nr:hypothetical protein M0802_010904 [Mischocyttarus mexicanus]
MFCRIRHEKTNFNASKNNDFQLDDKKRSDKPIKFQDEQLEELLDQDPPCQTVAEFGKILQVGCISTVSKRFKSVKSCVRVGSGEKKIRELI